MGPDHHTGGNPEGYFRVESLLTHEIMLVLIDIYCTVERAVECGRVLLTLWAPEIATKTMINFGAINSLRAACTPSSSGRMLRPCRTTPCIVPATRTPIYITPQSCSGRCCCRHVVRVPPFRADFSRRFSHQVPGIMMFELHAGSPRTSTRRLYKFVGDIILYVAGTT